MSSDIDRAIDRIAAMVLKDGFSLSLEDRAMQLTQVGAKSP